MKMSSSSTIQNDVKELKVLNAEIKRVSKQLKSLRNYARETEQRVIDFLKEKEQRGVKYMDTVIIVENKPKRIHKPQTLRENDALRVLKSYGINDAEKVLSDIMEARKGEEIKYEKIKIKSI